MRAPEARYDRSAATLPPVIVDDGTVLLGPRTPLTWPAGHMQGTKLEASTRTKRFSAPRSIHLGGRLSQYKKMLKLCVTPNANTKMCITPNTKPQRESVEYRLRWVSWCWGSLWACTFHVVHVNFVCVGLPT